MKNQRSINDSQWLQVAKNENSNTKELDLRKTIPIAKKCFR